jgi:hypothetical protein
VETVKSNDNGPYHYVAVFSGIGFVMVIFTMICLCLGVYLDKKMGTGYTYSLIMTVAGMAAGGIWTYSRLIRITVNNDKRDSKVSKDDIGASKEE